MCIKQVNTYILRSEKLDEPFGYSQMWFYDRSTCVVQVFTEDGVEGWGEVFGPSGLCAEIINKGLAPLVLGKDPFDVEVIWQQLYNSFRDYGYQRGLLISAISGLDIALWDIMGKITNKPVCKLLGGTFRTSIPAYATGLYFNKDFDIKKLIDEAFRHLDAGFKNLKMKIGYQPEMDIRFVAEVKKAIGEKIMLMVDANHAYNVYTAIQLGRKLESLQIAWFEEPIIPEDIDGYIEIKNALDIAIAGGECESTRYGFKSLIGNRAVDIVQPDTCCAGGLTEARKLVYMANTYGIQYNPHVFGTGIALHTAIHLIASIPDNPPSINPCSPLLEYDQTPNPLREHLTYELPQLKNGNVEVPLNQSGLGVSVDLNVLKKYMISKYICKK